MALHLHRSPRMESLVDALVGVLGGGTGGTGGGGGAGGAWPDPFEQVPIVVGSRGMERWLRHELATRLGVAAQFAFPFPRPAMEGATALVLDPAWLGGAPWFLGVPDATAWAPERVGFRLVPLLRERRDEAAFATVRKYLAEGAAERDGVSYRELAFAREVADVLDRLMHDRPLEAINWASSPAQAPDRHRWLAELLHALGATEERSPARLHERLLTNAGRAPSQPVRILLFGLSTLGPGDRRRIEALARHLEVRCFLLTPSDVWWQHILGKREAIRLLARTPEASRDALEQELTGQNAVLASLGMPSRDLQWWLEEVGYLEGEAAAVAGPEAGPRPSLLRALQGWIREARELVPGDLDADLPADASADDSLAFHATWGALRQVEALRESLRAAFAADPDLEPRDVVVMTPDLATFAPLLQAAFGEVSMGVDAEGTPVRLPAIPVAISDLGLRRTNVVAEALLAVLQLCEERVNAPALFSMLSLPAVRTRFKLEPDDVAALRELIDESGMRWAIDAADRAEVGQPELDQNTLRFGVARLALGLLLPDEDPLGVVSDVEGVPLAARLVESRDQARLVGVLAEAVGALAHLRGRLRGEAPAMPVWRPLCDEILQTFTATSEAAAWLSAEVAASLDSLQEEMRALGEVGVPVATLRRLLEGRFDASARGDRAVTGAVTVCALQPMRSVPFKLIALLGMDDGAFPSGAVPRAWDPMAEPEPGERDGRAGQRHLLLETILSARSRLWVYWTGFDVLKGRPLPAAVPVEELLDTLRTLLDVERSALVRAHPLQPWGPSTFAKQGGVGVFDAVLAEAARKAWGQRLGEVAPVRVGLAASIDDPRPHPPEESPPKVLSLDQFAADLAEPVRCFLSQRLQVRPAELDGPLAEREPLELDGLQKWNLKDRVLAALKAGDGLASADATAAGPLTDALVARLAGEGALPLRAGGRSLAEGAVSGVLAQVVEVRRVAGSRVAPSRITVAFPDGFVLSGCAEAERERGGERLIEWVQAAQSDKPKVRMKAFVHLLAARAAGLPIVAARVVGDDDEADGDAPSVAGTVLACGLTPQEALDSLGQLVEAWRLARSRLVPCFAKSSSAVAELLPSLGDPVDPGALAALHEAVEKAWSGAYGDASDAWIVAVFGSYNPVSDLGSAAFADPRPGGLVDLALRVWGPVAIARSGGAQAAADWFAEASSASPGAGDPS